MELRFSEAEDNPQAFARTLVTILQQFRKELVDVINNNSASSSAWDGQHLILGGYRIWVDATGDLRIKSGAPASDTDGTIVGTQS
jgi:hypothetical protein